MLRWLTLLCLTYVLGISIHTIYLFQHREFGPKDFDHPFILSRDIGTCDERAKEVAQEILKQKFYYLGYGGQMTVYESADHAYVLKFFNPRSVIKKQWFHRLDKLLYINSVKWIWNTHFKQKERLEKYFYRYEMSYQDLQEETALVYLHVGDKSALPQTVQLTHRDGRDYEVDLMRSPFVLQKKAEPTLSYLKNLRHEEMEAAIGDIHAFFLRRAQKGYTDPFQAIDKNYGFSDGKFVQFDPGRIRKDESFDVDLEVKKVMANIQPTLERVIQ